MVLFLLVVGVDSIVFLVFFFTVTSPSLTHLPVRLAVPSTGKKTCERIANNSKDLGQARILLILFCAQKDN